MLYSSFSQTNSQIATGEVSVTFNNECDEYPILITEVGISINAYAGMGGKSTKTRTDRFILKPSSSIVRAYSLDIGDKVASAYALKGGMNFCK